MLTDGGWKTLWEQGVLQLEAKKEPWPASLRALGERLGAAEAVGLGFSPGPEGEQLARAAAAGVEAAGGVPLVHRLPCPVQGAWAARKTGLECSLFVEEGGRLYLFDRWGLPPEGGPPRRGGRPEGPLPPLTEAGWAAEAASRATLGRPLLRRVTAAVGRDSPADRALQAVLSAMGCRLEEAWRPGIAAFAASRGGFRLTAQDEKGAVLDPGQLLALVALIEMENGGGRVAVPPGATAAVDLVAAGYDGAVLRLDRDGAEARELYASLPWLWSAPHMAARICARMAVSGQRLEALMAKTPRFSTWRREVPLARGGEGLLRALSRERGCTRDGAGLRLRTGDGWVHLLPLAGRSALRVVAEGPDLELAAELCDFYARRVEELGKSGEK